MTINTSMPVIKKNKGVTLILILLAVLLTSMACIFLINKTKDAQRIETEKLQAVTDKWLEQEVVEVSLLTKEFVKLGYKQRDSRAMLSLLKTAADNNPTVNMYYIVFPDNTGVFSDGWSGPPEWIDLTQEREWYKQAGTDEPHVSLLYEDSNTGKTVMTISMKLVVDGEFVGVVAGDFFVEKPGNEYPLQFSLSESLAEVYHRKESYVVLIDRGGNIIAHRDQNLVSSKEHGIIDYHFAGITDQMMNADGYDSFLGPNLDVYSVIKSEKYGYTLILVVNGNEYYASLLVFIFVCLIILVVCVIFTQLEERRRIQIQEFALKEAYDAAEIDYLTGILNRGAGETRITELLENHRAGMFCLFDLDRFKMINDRHGHIAGDKVICAVAKCMCDVFRDRDIVMRLGGDEFAIYAVDIEMAEDAKKLLDDFIAAVSNCSIKEIGDDRIDISFGVVLYDGIRATSFDELYRAADRCTYKSKETSGSVYNFADPE